MPMYLGLRRRSFVQHVMMSDRLRRFRHILPIRYMKADEKYQPTKAKSLTDTLLFYHPRA